MALTLANRISLPRMVGRQTDWLAGDPLAHTAFFRNDFTTGRHAEGGRAVSWPGGWTVQRDSAAYYSTAAGALIAAADDVARVQHFDADEMLRVLWMEGAATNTNTRAGSGFSTGGANSGVTVGSTAEIAPDGSATAWTVSIVNATSRTQNQLNVPVSTQHNVTLYGKPSAGLGIGFGIHNGGGGNHHYIRFNPDGTFAAQGSDNFSILERIEYRFLPDGWIAVNIAETSTPAGGRLAYVAPWDGVGTSINFPDNSAGDTVTLWDPSGTLGFQAQSRIRGASSRAVDNLSRDMTNFDASAGIVMRMKSKMVARGAGPNSRFWNLGGGGGDPGRKVLFLSDAYDTLAYLGMSSDVTRNTFDLPYVLGDVVDVAVRNSPGAEGFAFIADGILGKVEDCAEYTESGVLFIGASNSSGASKPDDLRPLEIGAWADGGVTNEELIDATAPVKTVAQIEGVTPLLDLWFEERAFSMGGKARGLSNILSHARDSVAYGLLSDGRMAAHPDDFPRLTFEDAVRAHLGEAVVTNKCTNYNANPTDLTGLSGSALPYTSIVDDSAALAAAGLDKICTSRKVIYVNNTSGSNVFLNFEGPGAADEHTISVYSRAGASGSWGISGGGSGALPAAEGYERAALTITGTGRMYVRVDAGRSRYIVLNQLEEGTIATSPIVVAGSAASRAADLNSVDLTPLAGQLDDFWLLMDVRMNGNVASLDRFAQLDGAANRKMLMYNSAAGTIAMQAYDDGNSQMIAAGSSYTLGERARVAARFGVGDEVGRLITATQTITRTIDAITEPSSLYLGQAGASDDAKPASLNTYRLSLMRGPAFTDAQAQAWIGALS